MRSREIIAANWKMNLSQKEALSLAASLKEKIPPSYEKEVILFPSFVHIADVIKELKESSIQVGGQNIYYEKKGAFTGEVAAFQLKELGCSYVLIGHSERRHYFHEDYRTVNKKVRTAIEEGLKVMLCVGESLEEREQAITEMVIVDQIETALTEIPEDAVRDNIVIAYEPIWAIGTGRNATPEDASHVHVIIRRTLSRLYSEELSQEVRILYGGSVNPSNIRELMEPEDIDGVLVGGASLKIESFLPILFYDQK